MSLAHSKNNLSYETLNKMSISQTKRANNSNERYLRSERMKGNQYARKK